MGEREGELNLTEGAVLVASTYLIVVLVVATKLLNLTVVRQVDTVCVCVYSRIEDTHNVCCSTLVSILAVLSVY